MNDTPDLTVATARAERDRLVEQVDVLDRVGSLAMLADGTHATTQVVADFYAVSPEVIRQVVKRNLGELVSDGYLVVTRAYVRDMLSLTWSDLGFPEKAHTGALFPRRAIVRVGMLLRDSEVARRVRDYLLNVEQVARETDDQIIFKAMSILQDRNAALTAEVAALKPRAEVADQILDAEGDLSVRDAAQALTRAGIKVGQNRLFALLENEYRWIARAVGDGRYRVIQSAIESGYMSVLPQSHYHPKTGVLVLDPPQPRVTPKGLQRVLADHSAGAR